MQVTHATQMTELLVRDNSTQSAPSHWQALDWKNEACHGQLALCRVTSKILRNCR